MHANLEWAEELPPNCPPSDAVRPKGEQYYRLVQRIPPSEQDFWSQRKMHPNKVFNNVSECVARSCSLISTLDVCIEYAKLPNLRNRKIVALVLTPNSGFVKKTSAHRAHYSWWRASCFDPERECVEIKD